MNRREVITGAVAAAVSVPLLAESTQAPEKDHLPKSNRGPAYSVHSCIDDPEIAFITITAHLKPETRGTEVSSMIVERATLAWLGRGGIMDMHRAILKGIVPPTIKVGK